jgi:predicted nucleic acid-binding protein
MVGRRDVFLDTSGLYALVDKNDSWHDKATRVVRQILQSRRKLITTDQIIIETVNLSVARKSHFVGKRVLDLVEQSTGITVEWIGSLRVDSAKTFYRKHSDHAFSFTDCTSFIVMHELKLIEALTSDEHFTQARFRALLRS